MLLSAMSISEAVQNAVDTHPQIEMKREDSLAQKELLTRIKSGYLPSVDLSYSVGPESTKTVNNDGVRESLTRHNTDAKYFQRL